MSAPARPTTDPSPSPGRDGRGAELGEVPGGRLGPTGGDAETDGVRLPPGLVARLDHFDRRVEGWLEPLRGRPAVDAAAKLAAALSDHGFVWAIAAAWRGRRPGPVRRQVLRDLALAGLSSSLVNAAVKATVGRTRPEPTSVVLRAAAVPVREPTSTSFPSGHTLAAFCVAAVMADRARPLASTARFAAAGVVGWSRLHLGAHHASDVLGGTAIGLAVGALVHRRH